MTFQRPLSDSYDTIASEYTARIAGELAGKPLDRALLSAFAEQVGRSGPICDLGCGPGHIAAFLAQAGALVEGIDLSNGMIAQASRRYPNLSFRQGDMRSLDVHDQAFSGIAAFYSIIHLQAAELLPTFQEWRRVLRPAGLVLIAFHVGDHVDHHDEMWNHSVDLDFHYLQPEAIATILQQADFRVEATLVRAAYPDVEYPSQRAYMIARKRGESAGQVSGHGL